MARSPLSPAPRRRPPRKAPQRSLVARLFDGWQAAIAVFVVASCMLILIIPRDVEPVELPEPCVDFRELARIEAADEAMAAAADRERLDVDVLRLGTAMFAFGEADAQADEDALVHTRREMISATEGALHVGEAQIIALRAHHTRTFLRELRRWQSTGDESDQLHQTAGSFVRAFERSGWIDRGRRVLADPPVLRALFKKRWNELAGLHGGPFDLALDEQRALLRFLLLHPSLPGNVYEEGPPSPVRRETTLAAYRIKKIDELAAIDPSYPAQLARGVALYGEHRFLMAAEAFNAHLSRAPDGPYTLRARNYLAAALVHAREEM